MITDKEYQKRLAQDIKNQNETYPVFVDGNTHRIGIDIMTKKETITLKKCRSIVKNIESKFGIKIKKIEIFMDEYDYKNITLDQYITAQFGDCGIPQIVNKKAYYYTDTNCLQIWQDGYPVYENNNGTITTDIDALADCLC